MGVLKISKYISSNNRKNKRIRELENLCKEKDFHFNKLMADGLRHGSSLAGKYMQDKKNYYKNIKK